ncbi:MAG: polysaccharide deacetylase family protein [Pseudomonadales bacterium]|nr:polysaccharide deacetylase family protein [Pseudomonadales bacterium]
MNNGWYVLNYHDISWEENPFISRIGGSFPPDVFAEHLEHLSKAGTLVSVQEGIEATKNGPVNDVLISFWFDDGFKGVRKYAKPILDHHNVTAAMSINSSFLLRKDMFWRCKLSFLDYLDQTRILRSRLKKYGFKFGEQVRLFTLDNFSLEIVEEINQLYATYVSGEFAHDAFRIFDTLSGMQMLQESGWLITNHSANHYPIGEASSIGLLQTEFETCEQEVSEHMRFSSEYCVLPFDRVSKRSPDLFKTFAEAFPEKYLVLVSETLNKSLDDKLIHRFGPPQMDGKDLVKYLSYLGSNA